MEFKKLTIDHNCDCTQNANEDTVNLFAIKTMKNVLRIQDFNSYWEKGKKPQIENCKEICSYKGVSISIFGPFCRDIVINRLSITLPVRLLGIQIH